jgi:hypothetical protein
MSSLDFEADEVKQSIPSRSSYAPSDKQKSYTAGDTLRFHIPPFQSSFLDPRQTTLNMKINIGNTAGLPLVRFSNKSGLHSLIETIRIYDANTNLQLESIQNYGELAEKLHLYSENKSIRNLRGLTEGLEYTSRAFDSELYDNLPARNTHETQLFDNPYRYDYDDNSYANEIQVLPTSDPNTIEVALHLWSGVIGGLSNKVFPALLLNGLRIEIDTAVPAKALNVWTAEGLVTDAGEINPDLGPGDSCRFGVVVGSTTAGTPVTYVDLYSEKNPGYNQDPLATTAPTLAAIQAGSSCVKNGMSGAVNLMIGKPLYGWNNANPTQFVKYGDITGVSSNYATENAGGLVSCRVFLDNGINGDSIDNGAGGGAGGAGVEKSNSVGVRFSDFSTAQPTITISDVQFIIKTLQPPQSYISSMLKQVGTEQGVQYDFMTIDTYRTNSLAGERVVQTNVPTLNHKATSIMTLPINNSLAQAYYYDNYKTILDTASNYSFLIDNKLVPQRKVRLSQLSQAVPKTEQVALFEAEKSLTSINIHPKNLDFQDENFFMGRALGRYGGVYNLSETGNASLRVEYDNPTKNKLMITYIGGLRRLNVNKDGRTITP